METQFNLRSPQAWNALNGKKKKRKYLKNNALDRSHSFVRKKLFAEYYGANVGLDQCTSILEGSII